MVESNLELEPQKLVPHKRPHIYAMAELTNGLWGSNI